MLDSSQMFIDHDHSMGTNGKFSFSEEQVHKIFEWSNFKNSKIKSTSLQESDTGKSKKKMIVKYHEFYNIKHRSQKYKGTKF